MKKAKIVGYQIVGENNEIPDEFASFEILTKKVATEWMTKNNTSDQWKVVPVRHGDIEEPTYRRAL